MSSKLSPKLGTVDARDHVSRTTVLRVDIDFKSSEHCQLVDDLDLAFEPQSFVPISLEAATRLYNRILDLGDREQASSESLWDVAGACHDPGPDGPCDPVATLEIYHFGEYIHLMTQVYHTKGSVLSIASDWHLESLHFASQCYSVCPSILETLMDLTDLLLLCV